MKITNVFHHFLLTSIVLLLSFVTTAQNARAQEIKTIAVLPFTINAAEDLTHIQNGIIYMLYSRLSWRDHVLVLPTTQIQNQLSKMASVTGNQLIKKLAEGTNSNYVVCGSITKLAGSFSIDTQVYDIKNKRFMTFFEQSKISDELIDKVDRIAATINKDIFDRSTVTYEKMKQEKQAYINKLKRQNPEHLMNVPAGQQDDGPGWKLWEYLF
ncbi:MAG: hypothetical protein GY860_19245 [Desulfobacteraceae bacterium]|nr:hypothetical protein [Desulfobacteraceae bacterium]